MEFYRRYQYTEPNGTISETGISSIRALIQSQRMDQPEWQALNPETTYRYVPALPESWLWLWLVQAGDVRGTFPKRVAQFYFKTHHIKAPESFLSKVGNLARQHSAQLIAYEFEFVDQIDWNPGQFGEETTSCWWGSRSEARHILTENGGIAIRFYEPGTEDGIARAWIVPLDRFHILFNGYGFSDATRTIARVYASFRGEQYRQIELTNGGTSSGTIFINSAIGYVIGALEVIERVRYYDLGWQDPDMSLCYNCDDPVSNEDAHEGPDGHIYCETCYYETFTYCDVCGRDRWAEDVTVIDGEHVCERCRERDYTVCENCGEEIHNSNAYQHDDADYCETCYQALPATK